MAVAPTKVLYEESIITPAVPGKWIDSGALVTADSSGFITIETDAYEGVAMVTLPAARLIHVALSKAIQECEKVVEPSAGFGFIGRGSPLDLEPVRPCVAEIEGFPSIKVRCRQPALPSPEEIEQAEKWLNWSIADLEAQLAELERVRPGLIGLALRRADAAKRLQAVADMVGSPVVEALVAGAARVPPPGSTS